MVSSEADDTGTPHLRFLPSDLFHDFRDGKRIFTPALVRNLVQKIFNAFLSRFSFQFSHVLPFNGRLPVPSVLLCGLGLSSAALVGCDVPRDVRSETSCPNTRLPHLLAADVRPGPLRIRRASCSHRLQVTPN